MKRHLVFFYWLLLLVSTLAIGGVTFYLLQRESDRLRSVSADNAVRTGQTIASKLDFQVRSAMTDSMNELGKFTEGGIEAQILGGTEILNLKDTFPYARTVFYFIPNVGLTNLIFDYEGKKLRDVSIEFEVTKEPEGTRIFYLEPQKTKSGTVKADVDFSKYGAGDYLAHVTIVHDGEKQDTHLPFVVGAEEEKTPWRRYLYMLGAVVVLVVTGITVLTRRQAKQENSDL